MEFNMERSDLHEIIGCLFINGEKTLAQEVSKVIAKKIDLKTAVEICIDQLKDYSENDVVRGKKGSITIRELEKMIK